MNTFLIKMLDLWNAHQLIDEQGLFWKEPGLGVLSWALIILVILIVGIALIFWLIKTIIKAGFKGLKSILEVIWKYCIWWWLKWILLIAIIIFILILVIQGFGIWLGDYTSFWWAFIWMAR